MRPAVSDQPVSNLNVRPRRRPPARAAPRRARRHRGPARLDPARRGGRLRAPLAPRAGDARGGDRRWPYAAGPRPEADVMRRRLAVAAFLALPAVAWAQERKALAADSNTQHDAVVFNVQQAYFMLLASYRLRDVAEETVAQNQKHLDLAEGRHDVGLAPRIDVTTAQVQLAQAELNQLSARNAVSLGRETLRNVVGLSVFNGGLTRAQVGEAKANLENLRATEDATRNNVTLEVRQALLNLRQQAESIGVADKGLEQGRENLSLAEGRYKTGVGNIIELTDAQVSLVAAEASRVQALVGYRTALATLERSTAHRFGTD